MSAARLRLRRHLHHLHHLHRHRHHLHLHLLHHLRLRRTFSGHAGDVFAISAAPSGAWIVSGSGDHTVRVWDLTDGSDDEATQVLEATTDGAAAAAAGDGAAPPPATNTLGVTSVCVSSDSRLVAAGYLDRMVRLWAAGQTARHPFELAAALPGHQDAVYSVAFSPDCATLASASLDRSIHLWSIRPPEAADGVPTAQYTQRLLGHQDLVLSVGYTSDGALLCAILPNVPASSARNSAPISDASRRRRHAQASTSSPARRTGWSTCGTLPRALAS